MTIIRQVMPWAVAAALGGAASTAAASGFQLMEQNASGLGASYAGSAAVAEDASKIFFNPAGLSFLGGRHNAAVSLNAIKPSARFSGLAVPSAAPVAAVAGALNSYGTGGDAGDWAYLPAMYYSYSLTPSVTLGLGINSPFGLKTHRRRPWQPGEPRIWSPGSKRTWRSRSRSGNCARSPAWATAACRKPSRRAAAYRR